MAMHRLNDAEYNNSVQDMLGVATAPADWSAVQGARLAEANSGAVMADGT